MILNSHTKIKTLAHDALLIVDVQNDYLSGGSFPVPYGDEIVPVINQYILLLSNVGVPMFASKDWHPKNHCSFQSQGGTLPEHCVAHTHGADFPDGLKLASETIAVLKGRDIDEKACSAFQGTRLETLLRNKNVQRLLICGLATDQSVFQTAKDALHAGFKVRILSDAIRARAVNTRYGDGDRALEDLAKLNAKFYELQEPAP